MNRRTDRCAIDEQLSLCLSEEVIRSQKDCFHGRVVCDDSEDDIGKPAHLRDFLDGFATQFLSKLDRISGICIVNCDDRMTNLVQASSHVRTHPAHSDKTDSGGFHKHKIITFKED